MTEIAVLAGGCFWCLEAVYQQLLGVSKVESGYCNGLTPNPTYQQICKGDTGHAEAVRVTFDPQVVDYAVLLQVFFATHDPTTLNRQGADVGTQYRSAIFYADEAQKKVATAVVAELAKDRVFSSPIITEITALATFYPAEIYHQNYYRNNPGQGYCQVVISPKVSTLRSRFSHLLRPVG